MTDTRKTVAFEVTSGALRATDPCYDMDVWCARTIEGVANGTWEAWTETVDTGDWGNRVASLLARHKAQGDPTVVPTEEIGGTFGVDSGTFGFFDAERYRADLEDADRHDKRFNLLQPYWNDGETTPPVLGGFGVMSSSGYGDGCYPVYVARNAQGEVIMVEVVFIDQAEDEDEDEEDDAEAA